MLHMLLACLRLGFFLQPLTLFHTTLPLLLLDFTPLLPQNTAQFQVTPKHCSVRFTGLHNAGRPHVNKALQAVHPWKHLVEAAAAADSKIT